MIRRPPRSTLFPYTRSSDLVLADRGDAACQPQRGRVALHRKTGGRPGTPFRSEEHTSELQSHSDLVCRLLLEKKKDINQYQRRRSYAHLSVQTPDAARQIDQ